ncbi:uncharacterized protein BXZ73DRAFT_99553 [Epithele typhae]|uniref:uncharacterized protein n=1 Tax=Epithele typhae TaxID=378194 RepID=UPI002007B121|nr:uncharacterized protein BXZ73DRAFT_99553 [Epithele typhae]KAH9939350.1 hypothetical protein BXZ73DRAFT_99553 [Epithele typhae]
MPAPTLPPPPAASSVRRKMSIRELTAKIRSKLSIRRNKSHGNQVVFSDPLRLPYIPPEVWGLIIQHTCIFVHDPLDTSQELSFLESPSTQLATYRTSMATKRSLCHVSKQWNALTRPFLYEFVWISRAAQAKALAHTLLMELVDNFSSSGNYIRRLHIETPALERCAPADLRTILDYSPQLSIYSDYHSVARNTLEDAPDPRCSPEEILRLVAHPKIRRLSWTSYDDAPFELRMAPLVRNLTTRLEYLELSSRSPHLHSLNTALGGGTGSSGKPPSYLEMNVHLPSLRALKVSLDNNTFAVLASWDMPALTNLSVLSSDFSYTGEGFSAFFQSHGRKLTQLELGHSSSLIEEYYLTTPSTCFRTSSTSRSRPDWIAPHILLPSHPRVELIGIRDINTRLMDDPIAPLDPGGDGPYPVFPAHDWELDASFGADADTPYFLLSEQISSLLRSASFPNLRFVRDLSADSHHMRTFKPQRRVLQFWTKVVAQCAERGVWFEDCTGVNITQGALRRAAMTCTEA